MNIALLTWGEEGRRLFELLESEKNDKYEVKWIADENSSVWGTVKKSNGTWVRVGSIGGAVKLFREGEIRFFLVPSLDENPNGWTVAEKLLKYAIPESALLYAPIETLVDNKLSKKEKLDRICLYEDRTELDFLELHVSDHCNLNCKNCSMFSGLVDREVFADYEKTEAGLLKLKTLFSHIKVFRVLGGEPLLNPQLEDYLILIRELYPYADIRVITNGILVRKMKPSLLEVLRINKISFIVTGYPALENIQDNIADFLRENEIRHVVSPSVKKFQKIYNSGGNSEIIETFSQCNWKGTCANIKENRLSACFVPFVLPYFTTHFKLDGVADETIDLFEEGLTTKEIRRRMLLPIDACRYCVHGRQFTDWELTDKDSVNRIEDWAVLGSVK